MDKKKVKELIEQIDFIAHDFIDGDKQEELCNLVSEVQEELNKSDWVSVEDGLPPYDESVLVTNKETPEIVIKTSRTKCKGWNTDKNGFLCAIAFSITHWKPIENLKG